MGADALAKYNIVVARIERASPHATWVVCKYGDPVFNVVVPHRSHRTQLLHQLATFATAACVYVPATLQNGAQNGIMYRVLVKTDATAVKCHIDLMNAVAKPLCGWMFDGPSTSPPEHLPTRVAMLLQSHLASWWLVRDHVLRRSPLPPTATMWHAWTAMYDNLMGAVDAKDRGQTFARPTACGSYKNWGGACCASYLQHIIYNASRLFRMAQCVNNVECVPTHAYKHHLRCESMRSFLTRAAFEIISANGETPPSALSPAPPARVPTQMRDSDITQQHERAVESISGNGETPPPALSPAPPSSSSANTHARQRYHAAT